MRYLKTILLLWVAVLTCLTANAQSNNSHTISTGGGTFLFPTGNTIDFTIGEAVIYTVGNATIFTQGFQQPIIDTTPPLAPSTPVLATASDSGTSNSDGITNISELLFSGTAEPGSTIWLYTGSSTVIGSVIVDPDGNWSLKSTMLASAIHIITAKATDAAGNTSAASEAITITVDRESPAQPLELAANPADKQIELTWKANTETDLAKYRIMYQTSTISATVLTDLPAGTTSFTHTALTNGTTYSYSILAIDKAGNISAPSNSVTGVPKANQTIGFGLITVKTYGDPGFQLGNSNSSAGLAITYTAADPTIVSISGNMATILKAGTTLITASQAGNASVNSAIDVQQGLTINKQVLTITADSYERLAGTANPTLIIKYNGFVNNETELILTTKPSVTTTATTSSVAGDYPITASGAVATNYSFKYVPGILKVNPIPVPINESPTLAAIASSSICYTRAVQTIALTGISAGSETWQKITLSVSSNNSNLFESLGVTGTGTTGTLSYLLKAGATGMANVTVVVKDDGGTDNGGIDTFSQTFSITINSFPTVSINSDKGTQISKGETVLLSATGGNSYIWTANGSTINGQSGQTLSVRPSKTTIYTVTATNASGCMDTQSFTLMVMDDFEKIKATNILSPNGDGYNDYWVIDNIDLYPNNEVKIFNRSGRLIYSKKGYDNSWDGTFNGMALAEGTYFYILDFSTDKRVIKGYITIVKQD